MPSTRGPTAEACTSTAAPVDPCISAACDGAAGEAGRTWATSRAADSCWSSCWQCTTTCTACASAHACPSGQLWNNSSSASKWCRIHRAGRSAAAIGVLERACVPAALYQNGQVCEARSAPSLLEMVWACSRLARCCCTTRWAMLGQWTLRGRSALFRGCVGVQKGGGRPKHNAAQSSTVVCG